MDHVQPSEVPLRHGEEADRLEVGEFVEVHNNSKTDPAEWLGKVVGVLGNDVYEIDYPFCDSKTEKKHAKLLRRARIFDYMERRWKLIKPHQQWSSGSLISPMELETVAEVIVDVHEQEGDPGEDRRRSRSAGTTGQGQPGHASKRIRLDDVQDGPEDPELMARDYRANAIKRGGGPKQAQARQSSENWAEEPALHQGAPPVPKPKGRPPKKKQVKEESPVIVLDSEEEKVEREEAKGATPARSLTYRWTAPPKYFTDFQVNADGAIFLGFGNRNRMALKGVGRP